MGVNISELKNNFEKIYGAGGDIHVFFAPGRVNLIGEHTDYNGGHVFPCALTFGNYGVARLRDDNRLRFFSMNYEENGVIESDLNDLVLKDEAGWTNYPKGVMWALKEGGYVLDRGLDILVYGDIPNGSGLSSSAAIEVMTGLMLKEMFKFDKITMLDLAKIGQYSENNFNGMNCGIMDQFASAMGKKDNAMFLDTATLKYEYAPVKLENASIVIVNSKVKHSLVDSAYNERRRQCEEALADIKKVVDIQTLGDLSIDEFEANKAAIKDDVCRRRAKHAVYENQRTIKAVKALKENDIKTFGQLMNESHISLRDDYETSCEETDILAELAWNCPGVIGARITGGGFGGCTVNIVENDAIDNFKNVISRGYKEKTGIDAEIYVAQIGDGAHVIA